MALFSKKTKTAVKKAEAKSVAAVSVPAAHYSGASSVKKHTGEIILTPRVTEKGSYLAEHGCYVFNVAKSANKKEIARAVHEIFGVHPRAVRTVHVRGKRMLTRGTNRVGQSASGKKAYVYLKKGEKIELV